MYCSEKWCALGKHRLSMFWEMPKPKHHTLSFFIQQTKGPDLQLHPVVLGERLGVSVSKAFLCSHLTDILKNKFSVQYL